MIRREAWLCKKEDSTKIFGDDDGPLESYHKDPKIRDNMLYNRT